MRSPLPESFIFSYAFGLLSSILLFQLEGLPPAIPIKLVVNPFSLCFSGNVFSSPSLLKDSFAFLRKQPILYKEAPQINKSWVSSSSPRLLIPFKWNSFSRSFQWGCFWLWTCLRCYDFQTDFWSSQKGFLTICCLVSVSIGEQVLELPILVSC